MKHVKHQAEKPLTRISMEIFRSQILLIVIMTVIITVAGLSLNLYYESKRLDENLQNVAETIAHSQVIQNDVEQEGNLDSDSVMRVYLDSLKESLSNIDVISVIRADGIRCYHSNREYIGTVYDGTIPEFIQGEKEFYASSDQGPSGLQRRAYAAIYSENGEYIGFVMAVMLRQNIFRITLQTLLLYGASAAVVIACAVFISTRLSRKIKKQLLGYEPDTFTAMFKIRENILESLEEGILAIDHKERIVFMNRAAMDMLHIKDIDPAGRQLSDVYPPSTLNRILISGEKEFNVQMKSHREDDIISDRMPIMEQGKMIGAVAIMRNRTEYTKLAEDLTGVRYMVESMRANNHDFTNKLHVILGLIQMGRYGEAEGYIMNITMVQRETIHFIMASIENPSVAALLIGKHARAAELNIRFVLKNGSALSQKDINIPAGALVTIIGNLLDNAMDAMNGMREASSLPKELTVGIFTKPHAMVITVDDTGSGIEKENAERIFENGFSTKGEGRGTGLYLVKRLVETYGGTITCESEPGAGTSFIVSFREQD